MEYPLHLVPQPRTVELRPGRLALSPETRICLPPEAGEDDWFAARQLRDEIAAATGLRLAIERQHRPYRNHDVIVLLRAGRDRGLYPPAEFGWEAPPEPLPAQAYRLAIGPQTVVVAADSASGLYYGVQTLRQIVRLHGRELPQLAIDDAPALAERGVMLDVCRGKVPSLATLIELVEKLSFFKINQFQMHNEHAYYFPRHPEIGADTARLTNEEMLELDAHCRRHHIELVPNLQSFGHMQHILTLPRYRHLAESPLCWSLAPTDEACYRFLDELYADLLPAFSSPQFNANCDEAWDLGHSRSEARMAEIGKGGLCLEHLLRVRELAAKYGRRLQVWADMPLSYPEVLDALPEDVTLLDWNYDAAETYPSVETLARHGRRFLVCPGTSSWHTLFPRIDNSNQNIRTYARLAVQHGAAGLLNTDWGDNGHYQPLGQSWYGYAYGAEQAWTGGTTPDSHFDPAFGRLFFGPERGGEIVAAMRELAAVNLLPGIPHPNASHTVYALFDEPVTGRMIDELPPETVERLRLAGEAAEAIFDAAAEDSREPLALREMAFSARLVREAGEKVAFSQALRQRWERIATGAVPREAARQEIRALLAGLETRWETLLRLRGEFLEFWQARAHLEGSEETLRLYRGVLARYDVAAHWLQRQLGALQAGQPLDATLATYGTVEQRILWENLFLPQVLDE